MDASLLSLIRETLNVRRADSLSESAAIENIPEWDSLGWVMIIAAIKKRYGIVLGLEKVSTIRSIRDLSAAIESAVKGAEEGR